MSKFTTDANALILIIAQGRPTDQATKDAITTLQAKLTADEANEADTQAVVTQLMNALAAAPPAPVAIAG